MNKNSKSKSNKAHINVNKLNLNELLGLSLVSFENESEEFKINYFNKVATNNEFDIFIPNILEINNTNIQNENIKYYPYILTNHSKNIHLRY
jgi:hypothetical protein